MGGTGFETSQFSAGKSQNHYQSGAKSGAQHAPDDNLEVVDAESQMPGGPAPSPNADPLLTRFLDAWNRLSGDDRLRLLQEAELLAAD